jgi:hypothetical protein
MRGILIALASALLLTATVPAAEPGREPPVRKGHALILVGLPGDTDHEALFTSVAEQWRDWLTGPLGFAPENVRIRHFALIPTVILLP